MSSSSSWRTFVAVSLALALATSTTPSAWAQTDEQKDQAKELFADGLDLRGKGDEAAALAKFEAAYKLVRSPITTLEFGRSLMRVGRLVEAREKFIEASGLPEKATESTQAKDARREAKKLEDEVTPRIPRIRIRLDGASSDSEPLVAIDGRLVPNESLGTAQLVDPGTHHVEAKLANGTKQSSDVSLKEGDAREVVLDFTGTTSSSSAAADAKDDHSTGASTLTYVAFGAGGAALLIGSVTGLMAKSKASDLKSSPWCSDSKCLPPEHDTVDTYNRLATISTVSFILAGIGAGVGVVSLLSGNSTSEKPSIAHVDPWIGFGAAGIRGAF